MNKVILTGRLTKDVELKYTQGNNTAVANFTLAVNRRFKKEGQQEADFISIVVWGKQAEAIANYMRKGSQVAVSGRIETRSYENKEGNRVYVTEVVADEVEFLSKIDKNENNDVTYDSSESIPF